MKELFQNLIWPAAAGNVAWAFFTVAVQESWSDRGVAARLAVLLLLAVYLATNWMRTASELDRLKSWYWVADAFHVVTIVVFAIATQMKAPWLGRSLTAVFLVTIVGHIVGAWEPTGKIKERGRKRVRLAGINALGPGLMLALPGVLTGCSLWHLPMAMALVLILWGSMRKGVYAQ